jgi:hypothetical protein
LIAFSEGIHSSLKNVLFFPFDILSNTVRKVPTRGLLTLDKRAFGRSGSRGKEGERGTKVQMREYV